MRPVVDWLRRAMSASGPLEAAITVTATAMGLRTGTANLRVAPAADDALGMVRPDSPATPPTIGRP